MKIKQEDIIQVNDDKGRNREYEFDGVRVPSVTTVINEVLNKPALTPWAFKVGVEESVKHVQEEILALSANDIEDSRIIKIISQLDWKQVKSDLAANEKDHEARKKAGGSRGLAIHEWLEAQQQGSTIEVDAEFKPYVDTLMQWIEDYGVEFDLSEYKIISPTLKYGGTLDNTAVITKHPPRKRHIDLTGMTVLLDFKSNAEGRVYPDQHLPQVEAYAAALAEMGGPIVNEKIVVGIGAMKDSKAKYQTCVSYSSIEVFASILNVYNQLKAQKKANPNARK